MAADRRAHRERRRRHRPGEPHSGTCLRLYGAGAVRSAAIAALSGRSPLELAHGSTLLLDELGDLSAGAEASLSRMFASRTEPETRADWPTRGFRLIATTGHDLARSVEKADSREDLYRLFDGSVIVLPRSASRSTPSTRNRSDSSSATHGPAMSVNCAASSSGRCSLPLPAICRSPRSSSQTRQVAAPALWPRSNETSSSRRSRRPTAVSADPTGPQRSWACPPLPADPYVQVRHSAPALTPVRGAARGTAPRRAVYYRQRCHVGVVRQ
jgi:hypothetical protein